MAKQALNNKAKKAIKERMKFASDTALAAASGSITRKNVEGLITSLVVNAKIIEADLNNVISYIPDKELALLKENGFECAEPKEHISKAMYVDFKQYLDEGFSEDGTDRVETITLDMSTQKWYASSGHRDLDGNYWYEETMNNQGIIQEAFGWIINDRKTAPTKQENVQA